MAAADPGGELDKIRAQEWFHGSITRHTAEQRLSDCAVGTYLFRESETRPGFSLSLRVPDKVKHFMISQKEDSGLWYLVGKKKEFKSMFDLIEFHGTTQTNQGDGTCLLYPCPVTEENPYVEMSNSVEVDDEALLLARRESEERRGQTKAHKYEHVSLGGVPEQ
mmetsp:Transcript_19242/g.50010  ORF Transcript_19242/g.50010 Transcript_19242/m.50010 type:complete len:164 (-) Transcript_19242:414-905(-)